MPSKSMSSSDANDMAIARHPELAEKPKTPKFQQRHYEALAECLKEAHSYTLDFYGIIDKIEKMLAEDNEKFNSKIFRKWIYGTEEVKK